jgi:hypothetical protein
MIEMVTQNRYSANAGASQRSICRSRDQRVVDLAELLGTLTDPVGA